MAYEEMSREEAGGIFFRAPAQPQAMPVEAAPMAPQPAGQRPTPVKASKSTSAKIDTPSLVEDVAASAGQMREQAPKPEMISPIDTLVDELISNWKPLAIGAGAVIGTELLRRSIQRRPADEGGNIQKRIEPTFEPNPPPPPPPADPQVKTPSPMEVLQERKRQILEGVQQNAPQGSVPPTVEAPTAAAPVQPPMAPAVPAPAAPAIADAVAAGESPAKAIQMDVAKQIEAAPMVPPAEAPAEGGIKKRAAKTQQTFKSEAAIPPGTTFRGDIGNLDRSLFNVLGPEHRRNAMELLNSGKPFGNVQDVNAAVKDITSRYWQAVQSQIPETLLGREERAAQGLKSEFGNYGALGKAAKVAGVAGTLLSVADLAKAAQQAKEGQYGEAAKTAIPAIDPTGIGTAAVQPQSTAQMLTNISPIMGLLSQIIGAQFQPQGKKAVSR